MANAQVTVALTKIDKEMLGYQACSLTHPADTSAPAIAAGSKVEIAGALFDITGDETITGLAGIANSSQIYILLTVSGAAFTASGTITAPAWDTAKQGWYTGTNRVIGGMYKDGSGDYTLKCLYEDKQVNSIIRYLDGSANIGGALLSNAGISSSKIAWALTTGNQLVTGGGGTYVMPAGLYAIYAVVGAVGSYVDFFINGGWQQMYGDLNGASVVIFSDGANTRLRKNGAGNSTYYWIKLA